MAYGLQSLIDCVMFKFEVKFDITARLRTVGSATRTWRALPLDPLPSLRSKSRVCEPPFIRMQEPQLGYDAAHQVCGVCGVQERSTHWKGVSANGMHVNWRGWRGPDPPKWSGRRVFSGATAPLQEKWLEGRVVQPCHYLQVPPCPTRWRGNREYLYGAWCQRSCRKCACSTFTHHTFCNSEFFFRQRKTSELLAHRLVVTVELSQECVLGIHPRDHRYRPSSRLLELRWLVAQVSEYDEVSSFFTAGGPRTPSFSSFPTDSIS